MGIEEENLLGPYDDHHFNGKEAEVIIYVSSDSLYIQTMARARRLLILVTHSFDYWKDNSKNATDMNLAIELKLVKKYQDMPSSSIVEEIQSDTSRIKSLT